ncbi:MAG: hypothetical protein JW878_07710 [Methanomicrobia archaeon]|nr:hypothetical protein [Methanomicrobia archaeon]
MQIEKSFSRNHELDVGNTEASNGSKVKKLQIVLSEGAHVLNPEGYIERGRRGIEPNTKELLSSLFDTYGCFLIFDGKQILFATPLKCSERTGGGGVRPSYRVGVFKGLFGGNEKIENWLTKAESKIREEINDTTNGFIEFFESANLVFNLPNISKSDSDIGYTLMNVVFKNKNIKTRISGLLAANILMLEKHPFSFYISNSDENVEKWNFDVIISKNCVKKEDKYSNIYDFIIKNFRFYTQGHLEEIIEIALERVDFYPPEYISFLWKIERMDIIKELISQKKVSKNQLNQFNIEQKLELIEEHFEPFIAVENIKTMLLRNGRPSISPPALKEPIIRDIVLEKDRIMLQKIPPSKISETLRKYGYEIKKSKEAAVLLRGYLERRVESESLKDFDEEGGVDLLSKLLKLDLLNENTREKIINKIDSKNDLKILCKKEAIWNKWEGKIKKRWKEIPEEVEEEVYEL